MYNYLFRKHDAGSRKFGNCQVCNKPADTIYYQQEDLNGNTSGCRDLFGHRECLEAARKSPHQVKYYKGEKF